MLELEIENKVCEYCLANLGVRSIKLNLTGNTGWPDRLFFIPGGAPLLMEFKRPGLHPEPRQRLIHAFLEYNAYDIQVHTAFETAVEAVEARLAAVAESGWRPNAEKAEFRMVPPQVSEKSR